jgi:hypothetical protein
MEITLTELEDAINYWRLLRPSTGEELALSSEVNALASTYAGMIMGRAKSISSESLDDKVLQLLGEWRSRKT